VAGKILSHFEWEVHQQAFEAAMEVFELSKLFPKEERYSLTDQIRRSSRSVCANLAEAWRKRRYEGTFISKLTDAEGEVGETQTWIAFAVRCQYMERPRGVALHKSYEDILRMIVAMKRNPEKWVIHPES
jgi:four helix bundle protein